MNNIESNNLSQFINFQNNYPIYSEFPFTIDNEISSNLEQPGIAFDSKYIFNHKPFPTKLKIKFKLKI